MDTNGVAERQLAAVLKASAGPDATPRPDQVGAVAALVGGRRVLLVQATGWGKSAVYWAATAALRESRPRPPLVVSPLLALMRDQVAAAGRAGLRAATVNSANVADWAAGVRRARRRRASTSCSSPPSGWPTRGSPTRHCRPAGQDRPAGRRRGALHLRLGLRLPARLPAADPHLLAATAPGSPVLATTATANARVTADVADQLGADTLVLRGPLARASLRLSVVPGLDGVRAVRLGGRRAGRRCPAPASSTR